MAKFKPTRQLEMDMMKYLLQDFETLKKCIHEDIVEEFWLNEQNNALYALLKAELSKNEHVDATLFYQKIISLAEKQISNFNESVYEDHFEVGFEFSSTYLNYLVYFKYKRLATIFRELSLQFERQEFDFECVILELEKAKKELYTTLRRKF